MTDPLPVHWYHIWCGDRYHGSNWAVPAGEHFYELERVKFPGQVRVGIVGGLSERAGVMKWLREAWPSSTVEVQADEGYEQVTIDAMHAWSREADPHTPVYYAHTKGAFQDTPMNTRWRASMDGLLLGNWEKCVTALHSYDAIGLHWLTHREWPEKIDPRKPMFGGNFWWATAGYMAKLSRVTGTQEFPPVNRWEAEGWLGQGFPKVLNLVPGWPPYDRTE